METFVQDRCQGRSDYQTVWARSSNPTETRDLFLLTLVGEIQEEVVKQCRKRLVKYLVETGVLTSNSAKKVVMDWGSVAGFPKPCPPPQAPQPSRSMAAEKRKAQTLGVQLCPYHESCTYGGNCHNHHEASEKEFFKKHQPVLLRKTKKCSQGHRHNAPGAWLRCAYWHEGEDALCPRCLCQPCDPTRCDERWNQREVLYPNSKLYKNLEKKSLIEKK